jgi:hypothetical protein
VGGFTSALELNTSGILQVLSNTWKFPLSPTEAKKRLQNYYPRAKLPDYDQYYSFPKASLVCIKQETNNLLTLDCYHADVARCSIDFSDALRRLSIIQQYYVDNLGYDQGKSSLIASLISSLYPGGVILFVAGLLSKAIGLGWSILIAIVYILAYTYLKSENRI